ncbi:MAG: 30S ribosome-binding factor RbfA [Ruminococcaceae bacterium]|nr:30S ribosome-binding factor RbfA [Oscillospiraceae bacterium]
MANNRINKINEEVRRELATVIRELKDSRIPMLTSVVAVNVTNDLSYAKCYISVMGDADVQKKALEGLKSASGFIRREVGRRIDLRHTPEFLFEIDHSIEHGAYINQVISDLNKNSK